MYRQSSWSVFPGLLTAYLVLSAQGSLQQQLSVLLHLVEKAERAYPFKGFCLEGFLAAFLNIYL